MFDNIEGDIITIQNWLSANKLSLNVHKTVYTIFSKPSYDIVIPRDLLINNCIIQKVTSIKFLGLVIDQHLTWNEHISAVCNKVAPITGILRRLRRTLSLSCLLNVYYAFIHSHFTYLSFIWGHNRKTALKPLQILQNRALRNLLGFHYLTPIKYLYRFSNVLPLEQIIKLSAAIFMYKVVKNLTHVNTKFLFTKDMHVYFTRQKENLFSSQYGSITYGTKGIKHFLITTYNGIPSQYRDLTSIQSFKKNLKAHLKQNYLL